MARSSQTRFPTKYGQTEQLPRPDAAGLPYENDVPPDQLRRMSWRAAGVQFYPGGAYEALRDLRERVPSYRGRGPKDYVRSDARLREVICERLTDNEYIDARDVSVEVNGGEVTLQGSVPMRQQKFAIEDVVAGVAGVREVHNRLSVSDSLDCPPPNDGLFEG